MERSAQFASIAADARRIGELTAAEPETTVVSCPEWTGRDLRAHVVGFARYAADTVAAGGAELSPPPPVPPEVAGPSYDADLDRLLDVLRATPADARTHVWSTSAPVAGFWVRRVLHELAVHRWDAATLVLGPPEPIPAPVALDGIAEFFDEFVATGLARGLVPPVARTLALKITDLDRRLEFPLPDPGPVTTIRGTASDLLLALWRRHDPLSLHVDGDPAVLEAWPSI
jgi:uncharacterized protein (TIGR03083 family)